MARFTFFLLLLCLILAGCRATAQPGDARAAQIELGAQLFHEPRLSRSGVLACASCHQPGRAYTDGLPVAPGLSRNTPTLLGSGDLPAYGWANPTATLTDAIRRPLESPAELDSWGDATALAALQADPALARAFAAAFPGDPDPIGWEPILTALAAFVRSLEAEEHAGAASLTPAAQRGRRLFQELGCATCHSGPQLSNASYHNIGLQPAGVGDPGLAAVTGEPADWGRFRVPPLQRLADTAPYMHDGSLPDLAAVVDHYAAGGQPAAQRSPPTSAAIRPFLLTSQDRTDLIAYLETL